MWYIKLKPTDIYSGVVVTSGKGVGKVVMGKGDQIYGDRR